ncbi:hypothetical protein G7046_g5236 [Stylonectria norvegica]|nr:hypothetical protein G7046_g5236 [Stylonectria norvegica]
MEAVATEAIVSRDRVQGQKRQLYAAGAVAEVIIVKVIGFIKAAVKRVDPFDRHQLQSAARPQRSQLEAALPTPMPAACCRHQGLVIIHRSPQHPIPSSSATTNHLPLRVAPTAVTAAAEQQALFQPSPERPPPALVQPMPEPPRFSSRAPPDTRIYGGVGI